MGDIIKRIYSYFLDFSFKFEKKTLKRIFLRRTKKAYKHTKIKLDSDYKKKIKDFWKPYIKNININFHKMYTDVTGVEDVRYIPDYIYYPIIEYNLNRIQYCNAIDDKNYYNLILSELKQPKTVIKNIDGIFYDESFNILDLEESIKLLKEEIKCCKELILKPAIDSCGGKNIMIINDNSNLYDVLYKYKSNYIVQHIVKQSIDLKKIHEKSLNTIRTISLLYNGKVIILSSILRMGINNSRVDNFSSGGICCGINLDGTLKEIAYDKYGNCFIEHPQGFKFKGYKINGFEKIIDCIKSVHIKFGHFKVISWDFAIDENNEPVFIEFNLKRGQIDFHQFCNGPLFGNLTEDLLKEVFR